MKEAMFWRVNENKVQCQLCPNFCILEKEKIGACGVRKNINEKLFSLTYGKPSAINIDPVEKKPLYHFLPGTKTFSFGTFGCTLHCLNCQNWDISQTLRDTKEISPKKIVEGALKSKCSSISYTYNEPTSFIEYALDVMKIAHENGLKNIWVTNGYINSEPLKEACKYMDAVNVDIKGFNEKFYSTVCKGKLKNVLENIKILHKKNVWIEITNLIISELNDDEKEFKKMVEWIASVDKNIPLHISAFYPQYKMMDKVATPASTLINLRKIAMKKLNYVYTGNIDDDEGSTTFCPKCKSALINRKKYNIVFKEECKCGEKIHGRW